MKFFDIMRACFKNYLDDSLTRFTGAISAIHTKCPNGSLLDYK